MKRAYLYTFKGLSDFEEATNYQLILNPIQGLFVGWYTLRQGGGAFPPEERFYVKLQACLVVSRFGCTSHIFRSSFFSFFCRICCETVYASCADEAKEVAPGGCGEGGTFHNIGIS